MLYTGGVIIDFHAHILPPSVHDDRRRYLGKDRTLYTLFSGRRSPMATAEHLLDAMDEAGVDVSVALGMGWCNIEVAREANSYLLEAARRFPHRIIPFCSVNPAWGEPALREIERCCSAGAKGVGELHPDIQGYSLADGTVMHPFMALVQELGVPVLTHASEPVGHQYRGKGTTTPPVLLRFIQQYPEAEVICAHWGGGLPFYGLMPEVRASLKNTHFDTAASPLLYGTQIFSILPRIVGPRAVLVGSDFPLVRPQRILRQLRQASLGEEEKASVAGANARRILGLQGSVP